MNICILGAGAWGTAMAVHLNRNGHTVSLVPRRLEHAMSIAQSRENTEYLPGVSLPLSIQIGFEVGPAIMEAELLFIACPSRGLKALLPEVKKQLDQAWKLKMILALCKGLDVETLELPAEVIESHLGNDYLIGSLSGPTNAMEVALGKPAAVVLAANATDDQLVPFQRAINSSTLRTYSSTDVTGVELGASLKNVYAIAAGISDGLGLGDNARAALITRAVNEMVNLGSGLGGAMESFYGLSGLGDLIATCSGDWSRNKQFGIRIATGEKPLAIIESQHTVVEGYQSTECFYRLVQEKGLEAPILSVVFSVLYEGLEPVIALSSLMTRNIKKETR